MPTAVRRKSSLSTTRRANQKYIPYGGDDFQRGKRTGIPVAYIEHSSDGFEPFEQLIDQADQRTPPRPKVQKKKKPKTPIVEEEESDEYGERDMSLEESELVQVVCEKFKNFERLLAKQVHRTVPLRTSCHRKSHLSVRERGRR